MANKFLFLLAASRVSGTRAHSRRRHSFSHGSTSVLLRSRFCLSMFPNACITVSSCNSASEFVTPSVESVSASCSVLGCGERASICEEFAAPSLLYLVFQTAFCFSVVSGCFVDRVSPSPRFRPELAPKRGLGGSGLAFTTPEKCAQNPCKIFWAVAQPGGVEV